MIKKELTPRKKQALEMRSRIQNVALELFDKEGFENVSVEQIAQAVGCSVGNIYHYFKSKDELVIQVTSSVDAQYSVLEESYLADEANSWHDKLLDFVGQALVISANDPSLYRSFIHGLKYPEQAILQDNENRVYFRVLRELIADPGDVLREVEKRAAAQFGGKVQLHLTDKVKDGKLRVEQGVIAGCAGGLYDNIAAAAAILDGCDVGSGNFDFSVYPPSVPVELELVEKVLPGIYEISNSFVRFYFRFLFPHQTAWRRDNGRTFYETYIREDYSNFVRSAYRRICQEILQTDFGTVELKKAAQGRTYFLCRDTAGKKIAVDYSGTVCYTSEDYDALQTALKSIRMETDEIIIFCENGYENALAEKVSGKLQFRSVGV